MSATHKTLVEIAGEIALRGVPVLFVDTCGALDVLRCAARDEPRVAAVVRQVIEAGESGELLLFGPSVLLDEAARNRVEVEAGARKRAREIDEAMNSHRQVAETFGMAYLHPTPFTHEDLIGPLIQLHDRLLDACVHVTTDPGLESAALKRAGKRRRPARGGGGANDCLMFEEFRSVARAVPAADPLVLLTTNTDDFARDKNSHGVIHGEIADDLAGTRAQICLNWDWAAAVVLSSARQKLI
jgi:hypothetical protein